MSVRRPHHDRACPDNVGAVFDALADATRRQVVLRLSQGPVTATELASRLPVSRQAVTKHLASLREAGLVRTEQRGREKLYTLTPEPMAEAMSWMATVGAQWDARLSRLRTMLGQHAGR